MTLILRIFIRPVRPLNLPATILSLYSRTAAMSMESSVVWMPYLELSRASSASSAECRYALVGMHPQWRHVPPSLFFSTSATVKPSWTARSAAA